MRAVIPEYQIVNLSSLDEVLKKISIESDEWKLFAGGTDLMVLFESGKLKHKNFLNINSFPELKVLRVTEYFVEIGAGVTYTQLQQEPVIQSDFPLLIQGAFLTGAKAIQNRGTVGGNIANMSPAADTPPSLLVYDAKLVLRSSHGRREVAYKDFHLDYKKSVLRSDEIIESVLIPRNQGITKHFYRKVGTRSFQSISKIGFSAVAKMDHQNILWARIALASMGPKPLLTEKTNAFLHNKIWSPELAKEARSVFESEIHPIDDIRSTGNYRKNVSANLLEEFVRCLTTK